MRAKVALIAAVAALAASLCAGCSGNNFRDVEGVPSRDADQYTLLNNLDGHPNLVIVCYAGVAFVTTTRDYVAVTRVSDLDKTCPQR